MVGFGADSRLVRGRGGAVADNHREIPDIGGSRNAER
jgi:hypothetical protein